MALVKKIIGVTLSWEAAFYISKDARTGLEED